MSSFIGQLRISLGLDSAAFETGAKRAAAEVNTFGNLSEKAGFKVGSLAKALVAGASAFAGAAIVSKLKEAVTGALEYASSLSEAAQQMGVTVESLQQFRLLAEQSGVEQETMDKALQKLTRSMGEAAAGGKKQSAAFDGLGISVRDASGHLKTANQLLPEIAGALAKVASPAERARYEVALFGKSGQDLEPLLGQGEEAIRSFMDQAAKAGIIISKDLADKSDAAADKITFLQRKLEMRWNVAVAEHAGDIEKIVDSLDHMVDRFFKLIDAMQGFANSPGGKFLANLNRGDVGTTPLIKALEDKGFLAPGAARKYGSIYGLDENGNPLGKGGAAPVPQSVAKPRGTYVLGKGPLSKFADSGFSLGSMAGDLAGMAPGLLDHGNYVRSVVDSIREVNDATEEATNKTETQTVRIAKSFADMAQDTTRALSDMARSIRSGDFLDILGSAVGLFSQLASNGLFGSNLAAKFNAIPGYAGGTDFHPGGLAMVGERGPELVSLPRGSRVYPNGTGPGGGAQVQVIPSPYFDVVVDGRVVRAAPTIANAGGELGYRKVARANARSLAR